MSTSAGRNDPFGDVVHILETRFGAVFQPTADSMPTAWCDPGAVLDALRCLKTEIERPFRMLYDLTAIDERQRTYREGQPEADFSVVYHLLSIDRNADLRIKVPLKIDNPNLASATGLWPSASWYEREVFDMFGITFTGHPCLKRILMPVNWTGFPLRKEHPARATEMEPFTMSEEAAKEALDSQRFDPAQWGLRATDDGHAYMFLNIGPHHTGTHGVFRMVLQLDGEEIEALVPEIGYHHRGAEKMGERQTWHTYIPYTDRVDYLAGVLNNFPYCLAVETLAGIKVPDRARVIRIMTAELFRIISHLVWYGTFAQDLGALSPVFYMFADRERAFEIVSAITGARMHPGWFRIGGVAQDLPAGWEPLVKDFLASMKGRLREYDRLVMANPIVKARCRGIGVYTPDQALEWGVTGPALRACGIDWDLRRRRPYSGYEQFDFEIPVATHGDVYDRAVVRIEEMRQSMRIIEQCARRMPGGPYKSDHPLAVPPVKTHTLHDIETLIAHFLTVSWGPVVPPGEAAAAVEGSKGNTTYYLVSDGDTVSYRTRIRTPSFAHLQTLPFLCRGLTVPDLIAVLGGVDFVLADVDR